MTPLRLPKKQRGVILLILFLMVFAVGSTVFLSSVNTHSVEMRQQQDVRYEMEKAKQVLLAYAVNYPDFGFDNDGDTLTNDEGIGRLICPDVDNDGLADSNLTDCTDNVRGRLPERFSYGGNSATINDYFANIDQQFWYVVSPAFKEVTTSSVNQDSLATLSIDGVSGYIAVIIAPGEALSTQDRLNGPNDVANYLEQDNVSGNNFINSYPADPDAFNDQVLGITLAEIYDRIDMQSLAENYPKEMLESYFATYSNLPTSKTALSNYIKSNGKSWFGYENYLDELNSYYYNSYPYIRYRLNTCDTQYIYYIPSWTPQWLVSGTAC